MATLEEVQREIDRDERVCLQAQKWDELWKILPNRKTKDAEWNPPPLSYLLHGGTFRY